MIVKNRVEVEIVRFPNVAGEIHINIYIVLTSCKSSLFSKLLDRHYRCLIPVMVQINAVSLRNDRRPIACMYVCQVALFGRLGTGSASTLLKQAQRYAADDR